MEGRRMESSKIIAVAALVLSIVGLSIGFSAFSNTLTIKSSANVTADSSLFDVNFSSVNTSEIDGDVIASSSLGDIATIENGDNPVIKNIKANFTEPGQSVQYSFYAHNNGKYKAFLNTITFANVDGKTSNKVCTPALGTDETMVSEACDGISISVKVGSDSAYTGSVASISNHVLGINEYEPVIVTINYAENTKLTDGDFSVEFGDISLLYSSVE